MRMEVKKRGATEEAEAKERGAKKVVDLSGMSLNFIPNSIANVAFITKLDLSNNNLESIPESLTARLLNVEVLDVHSNQLQALPNSIGCLSKLKILNVSSNLLGSLPKTIEDCRSLEELNVNFNELTRLPETMGFKLINLRKLSVNSNKLQFLPSSTSHMTSLRSLDARLNCLRSLPEGLENLIRLQSLDVSQNFHHLSALPYSLGLLLSLSELNVGYNSISVLPDSISCLTKLRKFNAEGNPLVRPTPEVLERGIDAVREFLDRRMNRAKSVRVRKSSWLGKLVRRGAFGGRTIPATLDREEILSEDYESSMDALATPRHTSVFSPLRLFSTRRSLPSSPMR